MPVLSTCKVVPLIGFHKMTIVINDVQFPGTKRRTSAELTEAMFIRLK